jgi:hypothetical protein
MMGAKKIEIYKFDELSEQAKEVAREWWKNEMLDDFYAENWTVIEDVVVQYAKDNGIEFVGTDCIDWDYDGDIYLRNAKMQEEKLMQVINNDLDKEGQKTFKFLLDNQFLSLDNEISGRQITLWFERENYNQNEITEAMIDGFENTIKKAIKEYVENLISDSQTITYKEMEKYKTNNYVDTFLMDNNYGFTKNGLKM